MEGVLLAQREAGAVSLTRDLDPLIADVLGVLLLPNGRRGAIVEVQRPDRRGIRADLFLVRLLLGNRHLRHARMSWLDVGKERRLPHRLHRHAAPRRVLGRRLDV